MQLSGNTVQNHNMSAVIEGTRFRSLPLCVSDGCAFTHGTVVERSVPCRPPQWLPVNSCFKMILLLGLIFILWVEPGLCLEEDGRFTFDGDIRQFVVTTDMVYAATKETLYQLRRKLTEPRSLTLRGLLKDGINAQERQFYRVSDTSMWNTTFQIHVLLPFVANKSLISCGMSVNGCGYCELLDLDNIHNVLYSENIQVGPVESSSASVAFLVDIKNSGTYILTAIQTNHTQSDKCSTSCQTVNLHDKDNARDEGIFSLSDNIITPSITSIGDVEFVDGFQVGSTIYLLSNNVLPGSRNNEVRLIWLQGESSKTETLKSLRGATLVVSEVGARGSRLVASSVIPGGPMLWSGVFSVNGDQTNTELVVFDISPDLTGTANQDPHFCYGVKNCPESKSMPKTLKPTAVLLRQKHMTSVLAVRHRAWMVFYMGTSDGQLIKLVVDKHYHTACPRVLYRANDNQPVFPKLHLDQVDHKHVYVALRKQMMRVPVSNCSTFTNAQKCLSAQDPNCVWCQSKHSCTFEDDCKDSDWLSIPEDLHNNVVSHKLERNDAGQLKLMVRTHVTMSQMNASNFACHFVVTSDEMCIMTNIPPQFPQCTCILKRGTIPDEGLNFTFKFRLGTVVFAEQLKLNNCSNIRGPSSSHLCEHCVKSGCGWSTNGCSWANQGVGNDSVCQTIKSEINSLPKISSISPRAVSFYGRNHAVLSGYNLSDVTRVRIQRDSACTAQESPVWNNTGVNLTFHIPSSDHNGEVTVCVVLPDGSCHGNYGISYQSSPFCTRTEPSSTWFSGKRTITLIGSHLEFVEGVIHSHNPQEITLPRSSNSENLTYETAAAKSTPLAFFSSVFLKVANKTLTCPSDFKYHPDPEFITFTSQKTGDDILITLEKKKDELEMTEAEVSVWGVHSGKQYPCIQIIKDISNKTELFRCHIKNSPNAKFQQLKIKYGDKTVVVQSSSSLLFPLMLSVFFVIPVIIVVVVIIYRRKQKKFTARMNKIMENLELDIRNDIRQGFVDLQTERADLIENVGTIPFLDYKHFACRIFFPESDSLMTSCIKEIGQDAVTVQLDECCQDLSRLIQDQLFLTSMVHALEEQKSFTIKDKCALASLLTVALHSNLSYLTEVMEVLLKDLMQQNSNSQPKLLLRRTESTVEKLLTNWMSICLYGFLRESVGQHLFLMVSALTQQIAKGPVDCVTEKALYTLNEDWLLWQAPDFTSLKLKVLFAVGSDGEVSEPLEVNSLSCDTVEQVKEKVLSTFRAKFGFPYKTHLRDIRIEYEQDGSFLPLEEVDASSEVIEEVTMLNTLKHYKIPDGATIKVLSKSTHPPLSPQGSLKDDENFSGKYFHLIDPDVVEDQRKSPERKKLKLKEVHLTKLLSTKVAVHSFVENLFKSICGMQFNKAPVAVKYFFDFLDSQAENMKITDPDVLHIWKTNSLLLRFWVNILKNPQFIFDMEKTPHLDSCLSVITQAFMDSFSLSELQLGKHAPTNRLLYAKDIPKFKQEVKVYYKRIKEQSPVTDAEFTSFLQEESMKHENEFNEAGALRELYKFIQKYFKEIKDKLEQNGAPTELTEQLHHVKNLFDKLKSCSWN